MYTLSQMAKTMDEVNVYIDDSLVQEVPVEYNYWCDIEFVNPADVIGIELFEVPVVNPTSGN